MAYRDNPVECAYSGCKIIYFKQIQENPLDVKALLELADLKPVMKNFGGKNYFSCEADDGNVSIDANKLYVAISWKWRRYREIEDNLESRYPFSKYPSEEWNDILRKRVGLFWTDGDFKKVVEKDLEHLKPNINNENKDLI